MNIKFYILGCKFSLKSQNFMLPVMAENWKQISFLIDIWGSVDRSQEIFRKGLDFRGLKWICLGS